MGDYIGDYFRGGYKGDPMPSRRALWVALAGRKLRRAAELSDRSDRSWAAVAFGQKGICRSMEGLYRGFVGLSHHP